MAVYTSVEHDQLLSWLAAFDLGALREFRGITAGIENTNFFVTTDAGEFVLTIFERLTVAELPFYLELMRHLASRGVACPAPQANRNGELMQPLCDKPAALVTRLAGSSLKEPAALHCALAGRAMAQMHAAGLDFPKRQTNLRGLGWWIATTPEVVPHIPRDQARLLEDEIAYLRSALPPLTPALPHGAIHADLFRDNALFEADQLGGFIDFYFAGYDALLFDVAVSINDWCIDLTSGAIIDARARAFLDAYGSERAFTSEEKRAWPVMLRAAAFRFWLSRLWDLYLPRPAKMLVAHDPTHFERILRLRQSEYVTALVA